MYTVLSKSAMDGREEWLASFKYSMDVVLFAQHAAGTTVVQAHDKNSHAFLVRDVNKKTWPRNRPIIRKGYEA